MGAFLLFLAPIGGGIPVGVLMAQGAGVPPLGTALLYFLSDVVLAILIEPFFALLACLSRRFAILADVGATIQRLTDRAGLRGHGARGPLGVISVAFAVSPTTGRAAAAAAGHGFVPGWALAITGDMGYFALIMASTLWLRQVLGDDKTTIILVLALTWTAPLLLKQLRRGPRSVATAT